MRIPPLFFTILLFVGVATAQNKEPYKSEVFSGKKISRLEVNTSGGFVKVMGGAIEPKVKIYVNSNNGSRQLSNKDIAEKLEAYILEVTIIDGTLVCTAKVKDKKRLKNSQRLSISFEIETPENLDVDIKTSGGSLTLSKLNGDIDFYTSGGSMTLNSLKGTVKGRTSGGSIKLNKLSGEIDLSTSGGSISAENSIGTLKLKTSGGSLTFTNLTGTINGTTSGGSIKANQVDGNLDISTSGGSITFSDFKGNLKGMTSGGSIKGNVLSIKDHIELITSAGSIKVDLPLDEGMDLDLSGSRIHSDNLPNISSKNKIKKLKTQINGGGKTVMLKTSSGSIYVN